MDEIVVAAADSEPVAEVIAGRLRSEGIAARVRYDSQAGIPGQIAPAGLGFGPGAFRVAVSRSDAGRARELLGEADAPAVRDRPVLKTIAVALLAFLLFSYLLGIASLGPLLFGR